MSDPRFELESWVTVGSFPSPWEARLALARLESEGIDSQIADENVGSLYGGNLVGGVKLRVRQEDAGRAAELLDSRRPLPEIYLVTEDDLHRQRCPSCKSDNLSFERWSLLGFLGAWLLLGLALPVPRRRWTCRNCRSVWKEEDFGGRDMPEPEEEGLTTVARFHSPLEAHLAKTLLESEGIDACVREDRLPALNLLSGQPSARNRLEVHPEDAERALAILVEVEDAGNEMPAAE
ncbi:MAG TPA: DUF2007 domain-containing protein [Thermoanaerobaculia bacterium]